MSDPNFLPRIFGLINKRSNNFHEHYFVKSIYNINTKINKILSTSLYGDDKNPEMYDKYVCPLLKNISLSSVILPDWKYRVYLDPSISLTTREKLINSGCEVFLMNKKSDGHKGSMWRFLPAGEDVMFICLDSDDNIFREKWYEKYWVNHLDKWEKSDNCFFYQRTSLRNIFSIIPITAKMWGGKSRCIPSIKRLINLYMNDWYGNDEAFLTKEIYPKFILKGVYNTNSLVFIDYIIMVVCILMLKFFPFPFPIVIYIFIIIMIIIKFYHNFIL